VSNFTKNPGNGFIAWGGYENDNRVNALRTNSDNNGSFMNYNWGNDITRTASPQNSNTWYQIVATYNGSVKTLFQNNAQLGTTSTTGTLNVSGATNLTIGKTYGGEFLNGKISMVKVYNRVLTTAEIDADFNAFRGRFPS
jgi:hypothetical protein